MSFGNRNLTVHLLKGPGGFGALGFALFTMNGTPWPSLILVPLSVYLLKGCPVCWTIGIFETLAIRIHERLASRDAGAHADHDCETKVVDE